MTFVGFSRLLGAGSAAVEYDLKRINPSGVAAMYR
jgi:hypothetical protein